MAMAPAMRDLAQVYGDRLRFGTLDVDKFPNLATQFGVLGAPTLILFCRGKELSRASGFQPAAVLRSWIADHLADC
jgi:thioredoxin 1